MPRNEQLRRLALHRAATQGRRGLKRKAPILSHPRQQERLYQAILLAFVRDVEKEIEEILIAELPAIWAARALTAARRDGWADDLARIIDGLTVFGERRSQDIINRLGEISDSVGQFNKRTFARSMAAVIGVDVTQGSDGLWTADAMTSWSRENASLIKSIPERMLTDVEGITQRAMRSGADPRETAKEIQRRFGVTESRAKLIGRDQVAKLNADLTKGRNEALGIEFYEWSSSGDERVRDSHSAMDGRLCRWDDPTVYSDDGGETWQSRSSIGGVEEHPGQDFQCRCVSRPVLDDVLEAL